MFSVFSARWSAPQGYREVLRIGFPLIAGMASSTVMQFTDRLFLSHYSVTSIAAALPAAVAALALQLPLMGLCGYVSVFIAHLTGAGKAAKVGTALWQGIWMTLAATVVLVCACFFAEPLFTLANHPPAVREEEIVYFRILTLGSVFFLTNAVIGGFFIGRGLTRPVLVANLAAMILNIPLDYMLIFGKWGAPELGIAGAAYATVTGWVFTAAVLGFGVFTKKNDVIFHVFRAWRFNKDLFFRLLRFGGPSGMNFFVDIAGFAWFLLEVGKLGEVQLAASSIALSVNSLIFTPMLGLNAAVSTLVGQAMGRQKPGEAEKATQSALHLSLMYMLPLCVLFFLFAGPLMDIFEPAGPGAGYAPIKATGVALIYYIAVYSLVDSCNIVYIGALKGAGDTHFILLMLAGTGLALLVAPIITLKALGLVSLHPLWILLTTYIMGMALCSFLRFRHGGWRLKRIIEA